MEIQGQITPQTKSRPAPIASINTKTSPEKAETPEHAFPEKATLLPSPDTVVLAPTQREGAAPGKYIAVAGNIGVGKSTLVEFLCRTLHLKPVFEPHEENPYLEDFYGDMNRWSFSSQAYFLGRKFRLHREAERYPEPIVQDRTIYEDAEVFARNLYEQGLMEERDFQTYWELYRNIRDSLRPPDLLLCLKADLKTVRKRIRMRGRAFEQQIPKTYLKRLDGLYENWFQQYDLSPKLTIRTDRIDYMTDLVDRIDFLRLIEAHIS